MSGKDERPIQEGRDIWIPAEIGQYRESIQHVLNWMNNTGLDFNIFYSLDEIVMFTQMSGVMGTRQWIDIVAHGTKRAIEEARQLFPGVFHGDDDVR